MELNSEIKLKTFKDFLKLIDLIAALWVVSDDIIKNLRNDFIYQLDLIFC